MDTQTVQVHSVRHMVISNVKGKFREFNGTILLDNITHNKALETGGLRVGDEIEIEINAEALKATEK